MGTLGKNKEFQLSCKTKMIFTYKELSSQTSGNKTLAVFGNEIYLGILVNENHQLYVLRENSIRFEPETFLDQDEAAKHLANLKIS